MVGAVAITLTSGEVATAVFPLVTGILLALVVYGRLKLAPQQGR